MRVVFFGTPDFAVPALEETARAAELVLVVAQPDRPRGRGRALAATPVKQRALALGLPCLQVRSPNRPGGLGALRSLAPDLFVVVAYGAILSRELLAVPRLGAINLHGSLLPAYRGASPIQAALLDGRATTGVSTMWMDEGLDTGDVILSRELLIGPDETAGELSERLAAAGAELLGETLRAVEAGRAPRTPQDGAKSTLTKRLRKADGRLDFAQPARRVHDRARAMTPWPGAQAAFEGETVRFERTRVVAAPTTEEARAMAQGAAPGRILGPGKDGGLLVACGEGALEVLRVTPAGRPAMDAQAWWRGLRRANDATAHFTTPRDEEEE